MKTPRADKASELIEKHGLTAMLFTDMANIRYLTGFTGSDAVLVATTEGFTFLTDSRYVTQANEQTDCTVVEYANKLQGIVNCLQSGSIAHGHASSDCAGAAV